MKKVATLLAALSLRAKSIVPDTVMALGALMISVGVGSIYAPAGLIVAGGFMLLAGIAAAKDGK